MNVAHAPLGSAGRTIIGIGLAYLVLGTGNLPVWAESTLVGRAVLRAETFVWGRPLAAYPPTTPSIALRFLLSAGNRCRVSPPCSTTGMGRSWSFEALGFGAKFANSAAEFGTHPADYLPNRVIVIWPFTDLSDRRFRVGRRTFRLTQSQGEPFKIGLRHPEGWAAYVLGDHLFIKSVPLIEGATYPDMGSNFETFTNSEFLELETLGPLKRISVGETLVHTESWVVFSGVNLPDAEDDEALLRALEPYRAKLLES
jgi:hypothetical protein